MIIKDKQKIFNNHVQNADMKKQSLKGGAITLTTQVLSFVIQMAATVILARLLTPKDYGIITMVVAVTGLASILSSLGLSTATIQVSEINHSQLSNLFWINVALGLGVTLFVAALSPVVAWFYRVPGLTWVTLALSSNFLIGGLGVQHRALLSREMRFSSIAKTEISSMVIGIAVAIILGSKGYGYWALVANIICAALSNTIGAWFALKWIPGFPYRCISVRSILKFGSDVACFNIINYFARNLDNILIGRYSGSSDLGLYNKAYQLLMMPLTNLRDPLMKVAMPSLSRLQHDPEQYKNYYKKFVAILAFISMPIVVFMYVCSDIIICLLLGQQWMGTSELFKILAFAAFIQPCSSAGIILLSTGRSRKYFILGLANAVAICLSFILGLPWGASGVAAAYSIVTYISLFPSLSYAFQDTSIHVYDFILSIYKPFFASISMGGMCFFVLYFFGSTNAVFTLITCFISSVMVYILTFTLFDGGFKELKEYYSYCGFIFDKK